MRSWRELLSREVAQSEEVHLATRRAADDCVAGDGEGD